MNKFIHLSFIAFILIFSACHKSNPVITPVKPAVINSHWIAANTNTTTAQIASVQFVSADTGFFFGYDSIIPFISKSIDGGLNWNLLKSFTSNGAFSSFYAINSSSLMVARDKFYLSNDGGNNFSIIPNQTNTVTFSQFLVLNNSLGIAITDDSIIEGINLQNWSVVHSLIHAAGYHIICFPDQNTGYASGGSEIEINAQSYSSGYGVLSKTTDGGKTWQDLNTGSWLNNTQNFPDIVGMSFIDADNGWIATDDQKLLHTTDGGNTWTVVNTGLVGIVTGLLFQTAQNGYYIISGYIYSTIDGGATFTKDYTTKGNLYSIYNGKNGKAYITGDNGLILIGGI